MKKLLTIAMMTAAISALAVESSNTFGILRVTIPAGQQNTVISAPWCDAGATTEAAQKQIKVKDIVKTANLTPASTNPVKAGDRIFVFNGNEYSAAFELQTVEGVAKWVGIRMVISDSKTIEAPADTLTIQRGQAIGLVLVDTPTEAKDIYLYGQYTTVGGSTTIANGSPENVAYTLVAPTGVDADVVLNSEWLEAQTGLTPAVGDQVYIPGKGFSPYVEGKGFGVTKSGGFNAATGTWGTPTFTAATVPTGTGFWYISKGGTGTISL